MSATLNAQHPTRLDIVDLPRDPQFCLGGLRTQLCATYNYTRQYPEKLDTFIEVLKYVLERAEDIKNGGVEAAVEAQKVAEQEAAAKVAKELEDIEKAKHAAYIKSLKDSAKSVIEEAQVITVLEDLKEYVIVAGFTVEGETLEEILAAFIKARTELTLAQVAEYKKSIKE
jgi:hypothetical protein